MRVQDFVPAETCHEGQQPSAWASWHRRNGLQGPVSNQMVKIQLPACFPHDLHLLFLTDICAVKYFFIIKLHSVLGQNLTIFAVEQNKVPSNYSHPLHIPGAKKAVRRNGFAEQFKKRRFSLPLVWTIELSPALFWKLCSCANAHTLLYLRF